MENKVWNLLNKFRNILSIGETKKILLTILFLQKIYLESNEKLDINSNKPPKFNDYKNIINMISKKNNIDENYLRLYEESLKILTEKSKNIDIDSIIEEVSILSLENILTFSQDIIYYEENSENITIKELNELVHLILSEVDGDSIADLCSGEGSFLGHVGIKDDSIKLYGQEINYEAALISRLYLSINDLNYKIENADILKDNILASSEIKFKKLFANFPWLLRLRKQDIDSLDTSYWNKYNNIFSTRITSDWIFSTALVNMLEEEGKAISLVVNGSLYKLTDSEVREKFIKNGSIEAVIQLPENIFPFTSISSSLIVFSHRNNQIKFIDASGMCQKGRRINILNTEEIYKAYKEEKPEFLVKVSNDEIINNESILLVSNYLGLDKIKLINPTPLQDVVQKIFRGYQITAKKLDKYIVSKKIESYNYEVLQLNDIQDGIISSNLIKISVEDSKLNKYLLKDGDVVISAKSTKVKSAVVSLEPNRKVIATGSIIVIRPSEKLNSAYLKVFLDSYEGKILLDSIQTGSVIVSINPSRLMQMEVPLLSMNKQEKLGNKYLAKLDLIKITKNKLKSLEDEIEHIYDSESLGD